MRTGRAQVLQAHARTAVLTAQPLAFLWRKASERSAAGGRELKRPRDREIGADARERLQHLRLGIVKDFGKGVDGDDEGDPDSKAERRQNRAPTAAAKLTEHVREVEHLHRSQAQVPESELRLG